MQKRSTASPPVAQGAKSKQPANAASASSGAASKAASESDAVRRIKTARTYYEILSVSQTVTENELKKAYRKASLRVHPDKNSEPGAVEAFQKVTDAFNVLSDARKREIYDQVGHERFTERVRAGGGADGGMQPGGFGGGEQVSAEDLFNMFFSQQGGAAFRVSRERAPCSTLE